MVKGKTFSDLAGPVVGGALAMALIWAIVQLAPVAASRWFGL
jgi:hypothetical protein